MTRANLYVTLSDGTQVQCVCDSTSAPEQGFIVEKLILPLLYLKDTSKEIALLNENCTMEELRSNAEYRYMINVRTPEVAFYEERYFHKTGNFRKGANLTERYRAYLRIETDLEKIIKRLFYGYSNRALVDRANVKSDFNWDDEACELKRRWRVSMGAFDYEMRGNTLVIIKDEPL
jgi:hypothetical protein